VTLSILGYKLNFKSTKIVISILFIITAIVFINFPEIDLKVSSLFYNTESGFYLKNRPFAQFIYYATFYVVYLFALVSIFLLILDFILRKNLFGIRKKVLTYLLISLILGPGLLVNLGFKEHWGRARPATTTYFGGDKQFTPAFIKTNQCQHNCSFTSGHAAAAFYFLTLVPIVRSKKLKTAVILSALSWGSLVGFVRIIQGRHFLSDVVFSAFFVVFTAWLSYYLIFKSDQEGESK